MGNRENTYTYNKETSKRTHNKHQETRTPQNAQHITANPQNNKARQSETKNNT